jgi:hypothetical protein
VGGETSHSIDEPRRRTPLLRNPLEIYNPIVPVIMISSYCDEKRGSAPRATKRIPTEHVPLGQGLPPPTRRGRASCGPWIGMEEILGRAMSPAVQTPNSCVCRILRSSLCGVRDRPMSTRSKPTAPLLKSRSPRIEILDFEFVGVLAKHARLHACRAH